MFRTVTVYTGEKISVNQEWMIVSGENGENRIPIEDIYSVIIDNSRTVLTVAAISKLTEAGAHLIVCNEKHLPPKGSVRVMQVTEKQYNSMQILVGERTATEDFLSPKDYIEL